MARPAAHASPCRLCGRAALIVGSGGCGALPDIGLDGSLCLWRVNERWVKLRNIQRSSTIWRLLPSRSIVVSLYLSYRWRGCKFARAGICGARGWRVRSAATHTAVCGYPTPSRRATLLREHPRLAWTSTSLQSGAWRWA